MSRPLSAPYSVELGFSFDTAMGSNLSYLRAAVLHQDYDACILIDGKEGSGKSVLALQVAHFLDCERKIDLDTQVCYYPDQFKKAVLTLKPGKAIVWDEARRGLNRRRFANDINLDITDMLAECRQHNLFLLIVMPSFYDMDMNVAVHRSRLLIHTWVEWDKNDSERPLRRGFFRLYNERGKNHLYANIMLRKLYEYPHIPDMSFDGNFVHHYVVDEQEYRKRKRVAELAYRRQPKNVLDSQNVKHQRIVDRGKLILALKANNSLRHDWQQAIAAAFGCSPRAVRLWEEAASLEGKGHGRNVGNAHGHTHNTETERESFEDAL